MADIFIPHFVGLIATGTVAMRSLVVVLHLGLGLDLGLELGPG